MALAGVCAPLEGFGESFVTGQGRLRARERGKTRESFGEQILCKQEREEVGGALLVVRTCKDQWKCVPHLLVSLVCCWIRPPLDLASFSLDLPGFSPSQGDSRSPCVAACFGLILGARTWFWSL